MRDTDKIDTITISNRFQDALPVTGEGLRFLRLATSEFLTQNEKFVCVAVGMLISNPLTVEAEICDLAIYTSDPLRDGGDIDLDPMDVLITGIYHNHSLSALRPRMTGEEMDDDYVGCRCELGNLEVSVEDFIKMFRESMVSQAESLLETFKEEAQEDPTVLSTLGLEPAISIDVEECLRCGFEVSPDLLDEDETATIEWPAEAEAEAEAELTKGKLTEELIALANREAEFCGIPESEIKLSLLQRPGKLGEHLLISENAEEEFLNLYASDLDRAEAARLNGITETHAYATVMTLDPESARLLYDSIRRVFGY